MAWTVTPAGSWSIAVTNTPADMAAALALPGSWPVGLQPELFVRADQVGNLPSAALAAGYSARYDASQVTGTADGALVNPADVSGHGQNLAVGGVYYYKTTGANLINGHPVFYCDGASRYARTNSGAVPFNSAPVVVHMVARAAVPATGGYLMYGTATAAGFWASVGGGPPGYYCGYAGTYISGGPAADGAAHVITFTAQVGAATIRLDGTQVASGTLTGTAPAAGDLYLGALYNASSLWNGPIGEAVVYCGSTLTAGQVSANEAYLKAKWGTP